ncbi:hypothetical protein GW756_04505 [bacterium]|nr:hypothetical protein [bacterium]NCQ55138.1 hypothetical protein [Candidatus Parcubacteria bacterium]NCS67349.1 hypothetical protein [Candidatus Peregrinibacteria bacterium]NCS96604.1 hypothetical protein [bacterium]
MPEQFGHYEDEAVNPGTVSPDAPAPTPGYPPPGQEERLLEIRAAEAAASVDDADALLAALDDAPEASDRIGELTTWVAENYPDIQPPDIGGESCLRMEERRRMREPDFNIMDSSPMATMMANTAIEQARLNVPAAAAEVQETATAVLALEAERDATVAEIEVVAAQVAPDMVLPQAETGALDVTALPSAEMQARLAAETEALAANRLAVTQAEAEAEAARARVAEAESLQRVQIERRTAETARDERETARDERETAIQPELVETRDVASDRAETNGERLADAAKLQADYDDLIARGFSKKDALQQLYDTSENPEHKERLGSVLATISALENALPGRADVVSRLIESSSLDLGAPNAAAVFANFLTNMEASEELSEEEKATLREVLGHNPTVQNASDAREALAAGRGTETLPDGTTRTIPYTAEEPLELAKGVEAYPDPENPGNMKIRAQFEDSVLGSRTFNFTCPESMSGSEATEQINFYYINAIKESCGITGGTQQGEFVTQASAEIDLSTNGAMTQAARFGRITMDNLVGGFDNQSQFLTSSQIEQVRWSFQWLMPRADISGDAAFGDNSETARAEALGGLGRDGLIFDANGNLKEENYRRAAQFINGQRALGSTEPSYEALRDFLEGTESTNVSA